MRRWLFFAAQLLLAGGILYWLVATGRFQLASYEALLRSDSLALVLAIAAAQLGSTLIYIGRWWTLARLIRVPVSLAATFRTGFQGLFLGLVLPGSLGIDGVRLLHLKLHHSRTLAAGLASVVMDRLTGYIALLLLGLTASLALLASSGGQTSLLILAVNASVLVGVLIVLAAGTGAIKIPGTRWLRRFKMFAGIVDALNEYRTHKLAIFISVCLALITHMLASLAWYFSLLALGGNPTILSVIAITSILTIARTIPLTPMGLGVTDGLAEELYRLYRVAVGAESQMLLRILNSLILLISGLAFLRPSGQLDPKSGAR